MKYHEISWNITLNAKTAVRLCSRAAAAAAVTRAKKPGFCLNFTR